MPARISFYGGAGEVTGSRHVVELGQGKVLLDCGLVQGHRHESLEKNRQFSFDPRALSAVLLSHAHIDHSGALPLIVKRGFGGPIHCTRATAELCAIMLLDSAHLQEEDAKFFNKIHARGSQRIEPLYGQQDAERCLEHLTPHAYTESVSLVAGASGRFLNAGHVLGAAMIELDWPEKSARRRLVFTGDLGRRKTLLMRPPDPPQAVDYLVIESTYGNRRHDPIADVEKRLADVVKRAVAEKGKILIPSFALERTQEILYVLEKLRRQKDIPAVEIFLDSPMATSITELFARSLVDASLSPEFRSYASSGGDPFGLERIHEVRRADDSKGLNEREGPLIIISASGMCEGGRILHHLRNNIGDDGTTILIVGYQAPGTLGRRLVDGAKKVKIFGLEHEVWARIEEIHSFSAHADQDDLLWFVKSLTPRPRRIFLVHGDEAERGALVERLSGEGVERVCAPRFGESFALD